MAQLSKTRAQWYWKTDSNNWAPYAAHVNLNIENTYLKGLNKVNVDSERYIDFFQLEQHRHYGGIKPREVKRELESAFAKEVIVILLRDEVEKQVYIESINQFNGIVTDYITPMVRSKPISAQFPLGIIY